MRYFGQNKYLCEDSACRLFPAPGVVQKGTFAPKGTGIAKVIFGMNALSPQQEPEYVSHRLTSIGQPQRNMLCHR